MKDVTPENLKESAEQLNEIANECRQLIEGKLPVPEQWMSETANYLESVATEITQFLDQIEDDKLP